MCSLLRIWVAIFYLIHRDPCYGGDWHHSISSMYDLFDLEADHLAATEAYIKNEYERLDDIRRFIEQREAQNAKELAEAYTESSINAFKTIFRIKNDWETLKSKMATTSVMEFNRESVTDNDVIRALKAIRRLQIMYEFEVDELTNGKINDYAFEEFDVDDCCQMADMCYDNAEFHCAYHWYDEAAKKYNKNSNDSKVDYEAFTTKYIWSAYLVGNVEKAKFILSTYSAKQNYVLSDVLTNVMYVIHNKNPVFKRNTANDVEKKFYSHTLRNLDWNGSVRNFKEVCTQNLERKRASRMSCNYYYGYDPFLWIGPLREESVSNLPIVKVYHSVLYESEINRIKMLAKPKLKKWPTDSNEDITLRKEAKFTLHDDQVFEAIANRIMTMTAKAKSEVLDSLTVTNYGLGGHYLPHSRYVDKEHSIRTEDHLALIIFHLDDVPAGGSTVIPDVHLNVPSTKGSAIVVYNMPKVTSPYGLPMFENAQYGSCPIFYGDKWTLSAWLTKKQPEKKSSCSACNKKNKQNSRGDPRMEIREWSERKRG